MTKDIHAENVEFLSEKMQEMARASDERTPETAKEVTHLLVQMIRELQHYAPVELVLGDKGVSRFLGAYRMIDPAGAFPKPSQSENDAAEHRG